MTHRVSVVVAAKNYGQYLPAALDSALGQTVPPAEIIVIDDGSTDDTLHVMRRYAAHPLIRSCRVEGVGVCRARNLGIDLAHGDLIAFLDADDVWEPTKLGRQLPLFADPAVSVVYARRSLIDPSGSPIPGNQSGLARGNVFDVLLRTNPVCFSSAVVRRAAFEHVGVFDPNLLLAVDYDLWLRLAAHYRFDYVDEPLVRYRTGHTNLSSRRAERIEAIFRILRRTLTRRDLPQTPDPAAVGEAWGSTCRSMGYAVREKNRWASAKWYLRGAAHDGRWGKSIRSALGSLLRR